MKYLKVRGYKFEELKTFAKQRVIERYEEGHDLAYDLSEWEEEVVRRLEDLAFTDVRVRYSLSHSQGDGFSFTGRIRLEQFIKRQYPHGLNPHFNLTKDMLDSDLIFNRITYRYSHERTVEPILDYDEDDLDVEDLSEILDKVQEIYIDMCKDIAKEGYEELEQTEKDIPNQLIDEDLWYDAYGNEIKEWEELE